MTARGPFFRRSPGERLAARLVTGPVGHLVAFAADLGVAWVGWARAGLARAAHSSKR